MYEKGSIIYFTPFYFKNGNSAKNKYFIVLKNIDQQFVVASLPTRKDHIPAKDTIVHGCVELSDINFNCFVIAKNTPVTTCSKSFDFPTHIYGHQLDTFDLESMNDIYKVEEVDYEILGVMKKELFEELNGCLKNSKAVKRKFKRLLSQKN